MSAKDIDSNLVVKTPERASKNKSQVTPEQRKSY